MVVRAAAEPVWRLQAQSLFSLSPAVRRRACAESSRFELRFTEGGSSSREYSLESSTRSKRGAVTTSASGLLRSPRTTTLLQSFDNFLLVGNIFDHTRPARRCLPAFLQGRLTRGAGLHACISLPTECSLHEPQPPCPPSLAAPCWSSLPLSLSPSRLPFRAENRWFLSSSRFRPGAACFGAERFGRFRHRNDLCSRNTLIDSCSVPLTHSWQQRIWTSLRSHLLHGSSSQTEGL